MALPDHGGIYALRFWARNDDCAQKKEGEDEKVCTWLRGLAEANIIDEERYRSLLEEGRTVRRVNTTYDTQLKLTQSQAKVGGSKYSAIFMAIHTVDFLGELLSFPLHFRPTKVFSCPWLLPFSNVNGGVSENVAFVDDLID